jgi:hypothetical protein
MGLGSFLKKAVKGVGHVLAPVVKIAAPIVGGVLGGPAGAALGSAVGNIGNSALSGKSVKGNLKNDLVGAAKTGALAYAGGKLLPKLGGVLKGGLKGGAASVLGGGGASPGAAMDESAIPDGAWDTSGGTVQGGPSEGGQGLFGSIVGGIKSAAGSELDRVRQRLANGQSPISMGGGGTLGGIADAVGLGNGKGGADYGNLGLAALATAQGIQGAKAYGRMSDLQDKALATSEGSYNERAPLRTSGVAGMQAAPVKLNLPADLTARTALKLPAAGGAAPSIDLASITGNPMFKRMKVA